VSIIYDPSAVLEKIAPKAKIKKLVNENASLKKVALNFVDRAPDALKGAIDKDDVTKTTLKVLKSYRERFKDPAEKEAILKDPALLIQRVQNEVIEQVKESIRENYKGERYVWLPSDADEPDPEHQAFYGQEFTIGRGEMPGDRPGCRCGMEILVDETKLDL
jgi:hypothetical protein